MIDKSVEIISHQEGSEEQATLTVLEITLSTSRASHADINELDFIHRATLLCSLGQTVMKNKRI